MSALEELKKKRQPPQEVTAVGIGEAALSMGTGLIGALGGTVAGVAESIRTGDVFEFTPAFESVMLATNAVAQYEPRTDGGKAAIGAVEELYKEWVQDPGESFGENTLAVTGSPLLATVARTAPEAAALILPLKAVSIAKAGAKGTRTIANRALQKANSKKPSAQESLVDIKTGEPVLPAEAPLFDKGVSFESFKQTLAKSETPNEGIGAVLKPLMYKPVEVLRDWGSPTLNQLADAIFRPTKADKSKGYMGIDLIDATSKAQGKFGRAFDTMIEPYKGRFRGVKKEADVSIVRGLRTGKVRQEYLEVTRSAREFLDNFIDTYVRPVLPDIEPRANYFPQVWDINKIQKSPGKAKAFLVERMKFDEVAAENAIRRIVENEGSPEMAFESARLTDGAQAHEWMGRIRQPGTASRTSMEKGRKIEIPEELLPEAEAFLVNDLQGVMNAYIRNATKRVEYARLMGESEGKLNRYVAQAIDELGISDKPSAINKLTKDVYGLADALQGKYRPIETLSLAKWNRRIANYETVLHLGLVSLASLPELAAPAIQFGFVPKAYAKGVVHAVGEATAAAQRVLVGKRSIPKLREAKALEEMGAISMNSLQSSQAARFTSISSNVTSKFMHATGLELLTDAQRVIAYSTLETIIARNAKLVAEGKAKPFHKGQLKELGLDPKVVAEWHKSGSPKEGYMADLIENAKLRGQRWAITSPNPATKPLMFSDPHFTNILLFKSFTSVFSNLFMKRALKELGASETTLGRRAGVVGGMVAATAIAYYVQYLRDLITGRENDAGEMERVAQAIDRAGLTGDFTYAYVLANPYRYGFTDSSAKRMFNLAGPAISDTAKVMDAFVNPDVSNKRRAKAVADMIPVANITGAGREATQDIVEEILP